MDSILSKSTIYKISKSVHLNSNTPSFSSIKYLLQISHQVIPLSILTHIYQRITHAPKCSIYRNML